MTLREPSFLHVANGTSTTMTIEAAEIPGLRSIWADPLYEGPVPAGLDDGELLNVRARFLAGGSEDPPDPVNDLREWRSIIERHDAYEELVLWFEHDLFDQLNLIQILSWLRNRLPESKLVSLVCIGSFPGRPRFKGLGELTPGELAPLLDIRLRVSEAQYSLAERAWRAFREPSPDGLVEFCRSVKRADRSPLGDTAALPYLVPALARFLQEYPWTSDGLSRSERRLLRLAEGGSIALSAVFPRMDEGEDAYYITDESLAGLVETLSRSSPPLLARIAEPRLDRWPLQGSVMITEAGRAVINREQDRIAMCGIDRWFGGVHVHSDHDLWRWDDARQQVMRNGRRTP